MTSLFLILVAVVILLCIWLNNISSRIGIPTLLAFIVLGIVFGNNGLFPLHIQDHNFVKEFCTIALIFIMFYGGFGTNWDSAKPIVREATLLASVGVFLTAGLTGLFCRFILGWEWIESFLLGSVVSSTDAASVFSILRSKKLGLRNNTAPMLEMESGSNDPCSYMLTVLMLSLMKGTATGGGIAWLLVSQILFGVLGGVLIARLSSWVLNKYHIKGDGYDSLFIFAIAIVSYALPDLVGGNGYLSAYIVGIVLGNNDFKNKRALVNFFDGVTGLMQVLIFFLLGLLARPAMLHKAILPALAIFAFMLLVARPLTVDTILTPFRKYPFRQRLLISFVGLRGAASIVFAIMATVGNIAIQNDLFNIVFCIVLISISLQGSLIPYVSKRLNMIDIHNNVMKTFNDYSDASQMQFGSIDISEDSFWNGKAIKDLPLPKNVLIAQIIREKNRILPKGSTIIQKGDKVIVVTKSFDDSETYLAEINILYGNKNIGKKIRDCNFRGLILTIHRGDEEIIPNGNTIVKENDTLVVLRDGAHRKKDFLVSLVRYGRRGK